MNADKTPVSARSSGLKAECLHRGRAVPNGAAPGVLAYDLEHYFLPRHTAELGGAIEIAFRVVSGRYSKEVYAIDTVAGHLLARIPVGKGPHGLCVYPQPGRYSLGHTGVFR